MAAVTNLSSLSDLRSRFRATSAASSASSATVSTRVSRESEDKTITGSRTLVKGKHRSQEDLRLLAISAQITEISYNISDIQTRIFEIQELRHQDLGSNSINGSSSSTSLSGVIDQALIRLDERLETVAHSIVHINSSLEPTIKSPKKIYDRITAADESVDIALLRKHSALLTEWEAVRGEAEILRDELKEDKWLAVFRNASDQADGMMNSLERVVHQCQDFIALVYKRAWEDNRSQTSSTVSAYSASMETYLELVKSLEAKKKYYMPSVTKVLSVLDKGVRDRVTKNGECLRRHADMRIRWKNLRERIAKTDAEMEAARRTLSDADKEPSEDGSTASRLTTKSKGGTPIPSRASSSTSAIARSISPFRKFAARMTRSASKARDPLNTSISDSAISSPDPTIRQQSSFFNLRRLEKTSISKHRHSSSVQLATPRDSGDQVNSTIKVNKPRWNNSPHPLPEGPSSGILTMKLSPSAHRPVDPRVLTPSWPTPGPRSSSRVSYLPPSSPHPPTSGPRNTQTAQPLPSRPPSRQAHARSESRSAVISSRARPVTPSQIPAPNFFGGGSGDSQASSDDPGPPMTLMQRAISPSIAASSTGSTPSMTLKSKASHRPSLLPVPHGGLRAPSPAFSRSISPSPSLLTSISRRGAQTPEPTLGSRAQQIPFHGSSSTSNSSRPAPRSILKPGPPSSYREGSQNLPSRPSSRATNFERSFTPTSEQGPVRPYVPVDPKDPLDIQVAEVVNSRVHGFLIERVDPPMKRVPLPGEEIKAQYAVSNTLGRKVLTCRLVVINRAAPQTLAGHVPTKKVMCRIGGGWQDLEKYLLSRQANMV